MKAMILAAGKGTRVRPLTPIQQGILGDCTRESANAMLDDARKTETNCSSAQC